MHTLDTGRSDGAIDCHDSPIDRSDIPVGRHDSPIHNHIGDLPMGTAPSLDPGTKALHSIEGAIDSIFPPIEPAKIPESPDRIYPEYLLHQSCKGNKYYTALQKYSRQFIDGHDSNITQFSNTKLSQLMASTISGWDQTEPDTSKERDPLRARNSAASSLFSWSSGDGYIAARKRQLQLRRKNEEPNPVSLESSAKETSPVAASPAGKFGSSQRLHSLVEKESTKFIQDRIEIIKAHHLKKASERISQRKRDDHEMHLRRLKIKEEKYEKTLKAAIALQNTKRNTGFFGALFGPKPISNSFTLDLMDADPYVPAVEPIQPEAYRPVQGLVEQEPPQEPIASEQISATPIQETSTSTRPSLLDTQTGSGYENSTRSTSNFAYADNEAHTQSLESDSDGSRSVHNEIADLLVL